MAELFRPQTVDGRELATFEEFSALQERVDRLEGLAISKTAPPPHPGPHPVGPPPHWGPPAPYPYYPPPPYYYPPAPAPVPPPNYGPWMPPLAWHVLHPWQPYPW